MAHETRLVATRPLSAVSPSLYSYTSSSSSTAMSVGSSLTSELDHHHLHHLHHLQLQQQQLQMLKKPFHDNLCCTSPQSLSQSTDEEASATTTTTIDRSTNPMSFSGAAEPQQLSSSATNLTNLQAASFTTTATETDIDNEQEETTAAAVAATTTTTSAVAAAAAAELSSSSTAPTGSSNTFPHPHHPRHHLHLLHHQHRHSHPPQPSLYSAVCTFQRTLSTATAASLLLMQPSAALAAAVSATAANQSSELYQHSPPPPLGALLNPNAPTGHIHKEWPYSWPVTHILRDSTLVPSTTFNYFSLTLLTVSLALNLYLSLVIVFGRSQRIKTHSLMKHIFISNLLLVFSVLPFEVMKYLSSNHSLSTLQPTAYLVCKVLSSVQVITEFATAVSITILAVDKWQSISRSARITNTSSMKVISFSIWSVGLLFALLILLFSDTLPVDITDSPTAHDPLTVCRLDFFSFAAHPSVWLASTFNLILLLAFMAILFVVPLVIATASHSKTYLHMLKGTHYSHVHDLQKRIRASDKEAVRMLTFALVIFALCWLPWHVLQTGWFASALLQSAGLHSSSISEWAAQLWSVAFFLARQAILLSTILMPLAYLVFGHSIRKQFFCHVCTLLCLICPFLKKYHPGPFGPNGSQSSQSSTSSTTSSATGSGARVDAAEVKKNSLQKLLSGAAASPTAASAATGAGVSMSPSTSMA